MGTWRGLAPPRVQRSHRLLTGMVYRHTDEGTRRLIVELIESCQHPIYVLIAQHAVFP